MIDRQQLQETRQALGRKLATWRKTRGLIQDDVARQVHSTRSTVAMVERGRQVVDRIFWLQCESFLNAQGELLAAYDAYRQLESRYQAQKQEAARRARWGAAADTVMNADKPPAALAAVTDFKTAVPDAVAGEEGDVDRRQLLAGIARPSLAALIAAVTIPFTDLHWSTARAAGSSQGREDLEARLARVRRAYQHSRYTSAAKDLPALLSALRRQRDQGDDRSWATVVDAEAYQVASALLLKSEEPVLAAIAAERSAAAAEASGDDLTLASTTRAVVHCLMSAGHPDRAAALTAHAADRLATDANMNTPTALSVYGALVLRGAIAAARSEDQDGANALLTDADRAARHLGTDRNLYWTAFGPTNVTAHRVAVAVELGDAGTAVRLAATVDLQKLELPERKAALLLDTARAFSQWGKWERAFDAIRHAERYAPEEIRTRPAIHTMINELAQRSPVPLQRRVREYARQVGANS
jgi:transcriptional regulator with XRE-family HTH domain